jgi:hypothetical protein
MVIENTQRYELFPKGEFLFTIDQVSQRFKTTNSHYRKWKMTAYINGEYKTSTFFVFPWEAGALYRALGIPEIETEKFDFEESMVNGKSLKIYCTVDHVLDKKSGYTNAKITGARAEKQAPPKAKTAKAKAEQPDTDGNQDEEPPF